MVERDDDVILLAKHWMHSTSLCQHPFLLLPATRLQMLDACPVQAMPRNIMTERALREYRKTALAVALAPWRVLRAAEYLENLCQCNESQNWPEPPTPIFFRDGRQRAVDCLLDQETEGSAWLDFAPGTPKRVTVSHKSAAVSKKRVIGKTTPVEQEKEKEKDEFVGPKSKCYRKAQGAKCSRDQIKSRQGKPATSNRWPNREAFNPKQAWVQQMSLQCQRLWAVQETA
jgi:hypothetical protein